MSTMPEFKTDPKRDATDSIRGYVYQAYQSVLAWMQLKENEILVLEGAEDFDVRCDTSITTTQVKDVSSNLTLRSQDVVDTINNFWTHCDCNPDYKIILRFLTTAEAGQEQGSPFGSSQKGLEYWNGSDIAGTDIELLRTFLLTLALKPNLSSFVQEATVDELREKLFRRIKWDMGSKPSEAIQYNIEDKLKIHGFKQSTSSHYSLQAFPHVFKHVVDLLSTKGKKELRFGDFLTCFEDATSVVIPRSELEARNNIGSLQKLVDTLDRSDMMRVSNTSAIGDPIPIVYGGIPRSAIVQNHSKLLQEQRVIFLCGSSGLGKTNLASLISQEIGGNWGWAGFRNKSPEQIKDILVRAAFEMNTVQLTPYLVLDDVDLNQITLFEREFISLVFSVLNANGMVIFTGPIHPPLQLLPKLWKNETCDVTVPYFDEKEVADMVRAHGLSDDSRVSEWARTILGTTSGHPQLVHARVRNLSAKGWPSIKYSDLTKPEDVEQIRKEARSRLVQEFPSDNTRVLAYRLSLLIGVFSRETALAVAETPPQTKLPGEAFDALVGPWVEREGENRFRISPLLSGAANNVLSEVEIKAVHGAIAVSIVNSKSINQFEVGTAFFHAFMAKHTEVLSKLAYGISTTDSEHTPLLYDAMSWFVFVNLGVGQKILLGNPGVELMLRLAQYKLVISSPESDKALAIIERIEETLNEIEPLEFKIHSEALAYGMILNSFTVQIPSSTVIRMLSRIIDLTEENLFLKEISDSFGEKQVDIPRIGDNKPAQVLFSYQGARLSGLDDLLELVTSLDALPPNKRDQLLVICNSDIDFPNLLINRAWWKEIKDGTLDVKKALKIFDLTANKSREWQVPKLTKACLVAIAVIQDEYGHATELALEGLDSADKEFPEEACLLNQRAKVLFHANRDSEALPIAKKAIALPGLGNVEFVYCCRNAGIAAAKSGDWAAAVHLFQLGAEKAKCSSVQKSMGIGLMADAAFALWKQNKYESSLLIFADVLDSLGSIPLTDDLRIRHLHATVRHSISWIHFDVRKTHPTDIAEPLPGMCSNQEPNEGIKDHRIIDISGAWELLASTEHVLGLSVGIRGHSQTVTGGVKPLIMAVYERSLAFESIFNSCNFDNLVPNLIEMLEGLQHTKILKDGQEDGWAMGDIPKLPEGFWKNSENWLWVYLYVLVASVVSTTNNLTSPLPVERWRTDLSSAGALSDDIDQFLYVLNGDSPDDSLYQSGAAAIFSLRSGVLAPEELWRCTFLLLNTFMNERRWVEPALESLLIARWFFATNRQRVAFTTPSLACAEIERCWLEKSLSGFPKIAGVLLIAAPYLNIRMSSDAVQMLKKITAQ